MTNKKQIFFYKKIEKSCCIVRVLYISHLKYTDMYILYIYIYIKSYPYVYITFLLCK